MNTAFLTRNFDGYSLDFAALSYENYPKRNAAAVNHPTDGAGSKIQFGRSAHSSKSFPSIFRSMHSRAQRIAARR